MQDAKLHKNKPNETQLCPFYVFTPRPPLPSPHQVARQIEKRQAVKVNVFHENKIVISWIPIESIEESHFGGQT